MESDCGFNEIQAGICKHAAGRLLAHIEWTETLAHSQSGTRFNLIAAVKIPLGLLAFVVLEIEGIFVPLVANSDSDQRTLVIGGVPLVLLVSIAVVTFSPTAAPKR
jgi:hypothetical protein